MGFTKVRAVTGVHAGLRDPSPMSSSDDDDEGCNLS